MSDEQTDHAEDTFTPLRKQLARIRIEEVRSRLLKALVLWEMGYTREAVSQFRLTAEGTLHRLLAGPADQGDEGGASQQRARLERGQCGKVIEWLYRAAGVIPARVALHLHTLLGWGSYASHHQQEGHRIEAADLAILTTIAIDVEDWVAREIEGQPSILSENAEGQEVEAAVARATAEGIPASAARVLLQAAGKSIRVEDDRFKEPSIGLELFWQQPHAGASDQPSYQGLRSFEPEDAGRFFGRGPSLEQVVEGIRSDRPVVLSGDSGAGKTSLLRAAILPWALQSDLKLLFLSEPSVQGLTAAIQIVGAWPAETSLMLIVDQFERALFASVPAVERQLAIELVLRAGCWSGIHLVFSLREDFLGRFWRDAARVDTERAHSMQKEHHLVVLDPMGPTQARDAINGMMQPSTPAFDEVLLDSHLLPALHGQDGIAPVHLQIVCKTLIDKAKILGAGTIDVPLYRSLGGARQILSQHLQRALSSERYRQDKEIARTVLKSLAGNEGRRWLDHGDLWQVVRRGGHQIDELELIDLMQRLHEDRLVVSRIAGALSFPTYSLSHDVLAPEVIGWRSRGEDDRDRAQELLEQATKTWNDDNSGQPLTGRNLKLVEQYWDQLKSTDSAIAHSMLRTSRRLRITKRVVLWALVILAAVGIAFGAVQFQHALKEQARAKEAAHLGVLLSARLAMQRDPSLALAWLRHISPRGGGLALRSLVDDARHRGVARVLAGHSALVTSVAFSPDGQTLLSSSRDQTVRFWTPSRTKSRGEPLRGHTGYVTRAVFSPDGRLIATSSWDKSVRFWKAASGEPVGPPLRGHKSWVYDVAFSPSGDLVASAGFDGDVRFWSVKEQRAIGRIKASDQGLLTITITADGKNVVSAGLDGVVRVWNVETKSLRHTFTGHAGGVYAVRVAPDSDTLISASIDSTLRLWSISTGESLGVLRGHSDGVIALDISPDGKWLASAGEDKLILLWNLATRTVRGLPLRGHMGFVRALAFSPDGKDLASASQDQTIRLWHLPSRRQATGEQRLEHDSWVQAVAFSPDGKLVATGTRRGSLQLWNVSTGQPVGDPITAHAEAIVDVAFSADGRLLASGARDGTLRLWPYQTAAQPRAAVRSEQAGGVHALTLGKRQTLFTGGGDGTILRWRTSPTGDLRIDGQAVPAHSKAVLTLRESSTGSVLASASRDRLIRLWDPSTLKTAGPDLEGHEDAVYEICFSPDDRRLASASGDGTVRIWPLASPARPPIILTGHQHWVLSVAFSPGGKVLASGGSDSSVRLWDGLTGRPLEAPLFGHSDWVYSVTFSPGGETLASGSGDKTSRLWTVGPRHGRSISEEIDNLTNLHVAADGKTTLR